MSLTRRADDALDVDIIPEVPTSRCFAIPTWNDYLSVLSRVSVRLRPKDLLDADLVRSQIARLCTARGGFGNSFGDSPLPGKTWPQARFLWRWAGLVEL